MHPALTNLVRSVPLPRGPTWYLVAYRWLLIVVALHTVIVTWNVWQVRSGPDWQPWPFGQPTFHSAWHDRPCDSELAPMLPMWEGLPQFNLGMPMVAALLSMFIFPRAGLIALSLLFVAGLCMDQTRLLPHWQIAFLMLATFPNPNAKLLGRASLIALWFWAGFHKLLIDFIKPEAMPGFTTHVIPDDVAKVLQQLSGVLPPEWLYCNVVQIGAVLGWGIAITEMSLGILSTIPRARRYVALGAFIVHGSIITWVAYCFGLKSSVLGWNIALAFSGIALIAPWREGMLTEFRKCRRATRAAVIFLLLFPATYYVNAAPAYLSHCVYVPNTPYAELHRQGEQVALVNLLYFETINLPLPPGQQIYEQYFARIKRPGDSLKIYDPRPWAQGNGMNGRQLTYEGEFRNNVAYGRWIHRHRDGSKSHEGVYVNGKMQGPWTWWHLNGKLASQGDFADDQKNGLWKRWHATGTPESEGRYDHNLEQGRWTYWYPDGQKAMEGDYLNGKAEGMWTTWTPTGEIESELEFHEGELAPRQ